ncbi:MAG: hypothetical protein DMF54_03695 [Acidobacteria bacterium]|nr:MAG: hypothetical protein DMF54_03695 [Acidobacteriota bacterium]
MVRSSTSRPWISSSSSRTPGGSSTPFSRIRAPRPAFRRRRSRGTEAPRIRTATASVTRTPRTALRENLRRLEAAGVPVALGTDMWAFPALGVSIEMDLYVRAGLAPLQAIRSATQTAARSLGIERDRGSLEPGKRADLLVLSADPLADVKNVRAIDAVYRSGRRIERGAVGR